MKELRLALNKRLSQLESESKLIDGAIQEIHRRFNLLDDVESWGLISDADEVSPAFESSTSEVIEEAAEQFDVVGAEQLDVVDEEREKEFQFAVSGELGTE